MPKRRIEDSDDDVRIFEDSEGDNMPLFGPNRAHLEDSEGDNMPLFGPNSVAEKIRQREQEEEQESQQPLAPEDYLKQEVNGPGFSHEDLNVEAVDQAEARLGALASLAEGVPCRHPS